MYENNVYTTYSYRKFYLLKSDGNIYEAFYKMKYSYKNNKRTLSLAKEKVIYSVDEYGHISDFLISSSSMPKMEMIISNTTSIEELFNTGSSGSLFYYTKDGKLILKTISKSERGISDQTDFSAVQRYL